MQMSTPLTGKFPDHVELELFLAVNGETCATFTEGLGVIDALDHLDDLVLVGGPRIDGEFIDDDADWYSVGDFVDAPKVLTEGDGRDRGVVGLQSVIEA